MQAQHWTDEQLLAHLYGVGPEDGHLNTCAVCRTRITDMQANRVSFEANHREDVSFELLARQRRAIYAGLSKPRSVLALPRWTSAVAMVAVAAGGIIVIEERQQASHPSISDAQLVEEVSQMAQDPTPAAVAPMEALFQE
jgi:hypothetical protein